MAPVKKSPEPQAPPSRVRELRNRRSLTQAELADLAGVHRNSIKNIESGVTQEVAAETAEALASALETTVDDLGIRVRSSGPPPSVRMRQLTREQRAIVSELLTLAPEQLEFVRDAIRAVRERHTPKPKKKGRRR